MGCTLGMVLGLLPKDNLLALSLAVLIFATRVNIVTSLLTAVGFSLIAGLLDPLTHSVGWSLLTYPPLETVWTVMHELPLVPWASFNNTVVLGSFALGLAMFYPTYRVSLLAFTYATTGSSAESDCGKRGTRSVAATAATLSGKRNGREIRRDAEGSSSVPQSVFVTYAVNNDSGALFFQGGSANSPSSDAVPCVCSLETLKRFDSPWVTHSGANAAVVAPMHWERTAAPTPTRNRE